MEKYIKALDKLIATAYILELMLWALQVMHFSIWSLNLAFWLLDNNLKCSLVLLQDPDAWVPVYFPQLWHCMNFTYK